MHLKWDWVTIYWLHPYLPYSFTHSYLFILTTALTMLYIPAVRPRLWTLEEVFAGKKSLYNSLLNSLPECNQSDPPGRGTGSEGKCCWWSVGCWVAVGSQTAERWDLLEGSGACGDPECHNGWWWGLGDTSHGGLESRGISAPGDPSRACRSPTSDGCGWPLSFSWLVHFRAWSLLEWVYRPGRSHLVGKKQICLVEAFLEHLATAEEI